MAVAYGLATLALYDAGVQGFRRHVMEVLREWSAVGRRMSAGKAAEAIALDFQYHRRARFANWLC